MEQTDNCQDGRTGWKRVKGLGKEHLCVTHRHRQQCSDSLREGRTRTGWRWAKGEIGDICNSVNNKNKEKTKYLDIVINTTANEETFIQVILNTRWSSESV